MALISLGAFDRRVAGVGEGVAVGPGRLLQVKRTAMPNAAAVSIGETAAVEELCRQPWRIETAERRLRMGCVRETERADAAVAFGLTQNIW